MPGLGAGTSRWVGSPPCLPGGCRRPLPSAPTGSTPTCAGRAATQVRLSAWERLAAVRTAMLGEFAAAGLGVAV